MEDYNPNRDSHMAYVERERQLDEDKDESTLVSPFATQDTLTASNN